MSEKCVRLEAYFVGGFSEFPSLSKFGGIDRGKRGGRPTVRFRVWYGDQSSLFLTPSGDSVGVILDTYKIQIRNTTTNSSAGNFDGGFSKFHSPSKFGGINRGKRG